MPTILNFQPRAMKLVAGAIIAALATPVAAQDRLPWLRDEPSPPVSYEQPRSSVNRDALPPPVEMNNSSSAPRAVLPDYGSPAYGGREDAYRPPARSGSGGYAAPLPAGRDDAYRPPSRFGASEPAYEPAPVVRDERDWRDDNRYDHQRSRQAYSEPVRPYTYDREVPPKDGTFSMREIVDAGHGFFGSVSQGLASVLEYTFKTQGRPNGYILGEDLGGAFVAGLRYGEGRLHTRDAGTHRVYWQGPSLGYDAGAEGSKVMVLVYNMRDPEDIYQRFGGVAGSAYVVGGVGLTFQRRDDIVLAPIRAGLGLRLGANVGYLKYTRRPTWNPF